MSPLKLHGIVPPVVTPYSADGAIDTHSLLRRVVRHLLDGGVHGLFALGTTSECVFLDPAQRATVIETIVRPNRPLSDEAVAKVRAILVECGLLRVT